MDTTEKVLTRRDFAGDAVLVACSMLSFISVLGVFVILGVSALQSRHSSDRKLFVRTQVAKYLISLLICNLVQAVGGILSISWLAENRVYVGVACTAQGALKQIGNTGPAIFTFVIAVQTFSLLFLYRDWSNRTCNIVLIVSWALLLFELCLENFVLTSPEKGPYYGISTGGIWCWISPKYRIARYTTDYLFMTASAAFSFILYSLVFFRLRGNISVSAGYRISFHPRPATRIGRTSDGTFVVTDDRRVESYLTTVAKHMLWYPIVYTFLIFPVAASRLSTFHGKPVPFFATMLTAAIFMLHGFFNTVLFCTTRSILPGSWRQKFGLQATLESGRGNAGQSGATNPTSQCTGTSTRSTGTSGTGPFPVVLNIHAEDVEIKYEAGQGVSEVKSGPTLPISLISSTSSTSSISPASLLQICGGSGQPANAHEHHIPPFSSPAPPDSRGSTCSKAGEDDKSSDLSVGIPLESMGKEVELEVPEYLGRASSDHESGVYGPARA